MRACAPVEMMIERAVYSVPPTSTSSGDEREVDAIDVGGHELGAEPLGLLAELRHEVGTEDSVGKTRVVLDVGGQHELAARLQALDDERMQVGARGVDRSGEARRAGSDDDDVARRSWTGLLAPPVPRLKGCAWSNRTRRRA